MNPQPFVYESRFSNHSFRQKADVWIEKSKESVLRGLAASAFRNKLNPIDLYEIKRNKFRELFKLDEEQVPQYTGIELKTLKFFEAVEIDNFEDYVSILTNKLKDQSPWRSDLQKSSIKKQLDEIKTSFDSVSYGGEIAHQEFDGSKKNDLMQSAGIGYIKTLESYFILTIEVKPSQKFAEILKKIVAAENMGMDHLRFYGLSKILRKGIFISHTQAKMSTMAHSLSNLIGDLNHQVKINIANHLCGLFNKVSLPRIEYYEVESMDEFQKDKKLERFIASPANAFSLDDNKIHIVASTYYRKQSGALRVIKEKGHGKKEASKSDHTDYDWVETHYLLQSLSLPWALQAIFVQQRDEFNTLKRKVYDYIKDTSQSGILKTLNFVGYSRRYVGLKILLARGVLLFKRFEDEFGPRNLRIFSRDPSLDIFKNKTTDPHMVDKEKNLQLHFESFLTLQIKELNKNIETLQQVFKPIEDISVYRTNFWLQIISISIGIVAIIMTLDKAWEVVVKFFGWIKEFF